MSCGVVHRLSLDLALLWLWRRPAPVALIRPPAWKPPYATGAALKKTKKKKRRRRKEKKTNNILSVFPEIICHHFKCTMLFYLILYLGGGFFFLFFTLACKTDHILLFIYLFICLFAFSRAAPAAYGGSPARGLIGTVATGLHQSHSNTGSKPRL